MGGGGKRRTKGEEDEILCTTYLTTEGRGGHP